MASDKRHLLNPRRRSSVTFFFFSIISLSPTMPISAVPDATLSGMSSSRRNNNSTGKLREGTNNVRFTATSLIPASPNNSIVSS